MGTTSSFFGGGGGSGGGGLISGCNTYGVPLPQYIKSYDHCSTTQDVVGPTHCAQQICNTGIVSVSDDTFIATFSTGQDCCTRLCARAFQIDEDDGSITAKSNWTTVLCSSNSQGNIENPTIVSDGCCNIYFGTIRCSSNGGHSCIYRYTGSSLSARCLFYTCGTYAQYHTHTYAGKPGYVHTTNHANNASRHYQILKNGVIDGYFCLGNYCCVTPYAGPIAHNKAVVIGLDNNETCVVQKIYSRVGTDCTFVSCTIPVYCSDKTTFCCISQCGNQTCYMPNSNLIGYGIGTGQLYVFHDDSESLRFFNESCSRNACCFLNGVYKISDTGYEVRLDLYHGQNWRAPGCGGGGLNRDSLHFNQNLTYGAGGCTSMQHNGVRSTGLACSSCCQSFKYAPFIEDISKLDTACRISDALYSYGTSTPECISSSSFRYGNTAIVGKSWRVGIYHNNDTSCLCTEFVVEKINV